MKKIFLLGFVAFVTFYSAQIGLANSIFVDGTVVRERASAKSYLIVDGTKRRIADRFTFSQVIEPGKRPLISEKSTLDLIPSGDLLKISPPKILGIYDMHEHYRAGGFLNIYKSITKQFGFKKTVFVPTGASPDNRGYLLNMSELLKRKKEDPENIVAFCSIDEADPLASIIFEKCLDDGGEGLKLLGGHPELYDEPFDSENMQKIFSIANKRDVPVMAHVSIINIPQIKAEFTRLMDMFPDTRVQIAHYCSAITRGIHLHECGELLDKYPNTIVDMSLGGGLEGYFRNINREFVGPNGGLPTGEKATSLEITKNFLLKYQDRVVYGTDIILSKSGPSTEPAWVSRRIMCDISLLQEKWFRCPLINKESALLPGFDLPKEVLQKIFVDNPKKFLKEKLDS